MYCFLLNVFKCSPMKTYPPEGVRTLISTAPFSCPGVNLRHWSCEHFVLHGFRCWNGCVLGWEWWMYQLETWLFFCENDWCPLWVKKKELGDVLKYCNPRHLNTCWGLVFENMFSGGPNTELRTLGRFWMQRGIGEISPLNRWMT